MLWDFLYGKSIKATKAAVNFIVSITNFKCGGYIYGLIQGSSLFTVFLSCHSSWYYVLNR